MHGEALAAIQCIVFAHVSLKEHICNHKAEVVATGIGNTFGNKGGCGIALAGVKQAFSLLALISRRINTKSLRGTSIFKR